MRLQLAGVTYDLTARTLVIGRAAAAAAVNDDGAAGAARRLVEAGADVVEVTEPEMVPVLVATGIPVAIATSRFDAVAAAYQAGAVLGACPDPAFLPASARAGASVLTGDPAAALRAGLPAERIAAHHPHGSFAAVVTTDDYAEMAVAVTAGARLIRTADVRAARRVADVLGAILGARQP